jgi:hypothetical protein
MKNPHMSVHTIKGYKVTTVVIAVFPAITTRKNPVVTL